MGQGVKRTQRDYSLTFKLAVVEQIEKGELTYKQAQARYGIQGRSTVLVWLRKHGRQDWSQGASVRAGRSITMPDPDNQTPEQRIKELEQQLALMSQKAQFFEAVVDVLKNDYGVSIVKKRDPASPLAAASREADLRHAQGLQVVRFVRQVRLRQPRVGTRKLHYLLQGQDDGGLKVGRDRLFQILAEHRLLVQPRRAYHKTTHSFHRFYRHPNLLKAGPEQVTPVAPEQVWVADITYLPARSGPLYLSLVTDAYSRKIVGHHVHEGMHAESVAMAFKKALKQRRSSGKLIHHSDRGVQYCSGLYQSLHARYGVKCSMTDGYDCYQNALAERVNGILKGELLLQSPQDLAQAREMVREAVDIYNLERPHHALTYRTPDAVHRGF
ncbi:IS3 family transposase [Aeromonas rivipollensis]|uniref:IS3 family transposase n=1 Tax=Aeromonas rivipollensis TaxID=948519 RepID=UPI003D1E8504